MFWFLPNNGILFISLYSSIYKRLISTFLWLWSMFYIKNMAKNVGTQMNLFEWQSLMWSTALIPSSKTIEVNFNALTNETITITLHVQGLYDTDCSLFLWLWSMFYVKKWQKMLEQKTSQSVVYRGRYLIAKWRLFNLNFFWTFVLAFGKIIHTSPTKVITLRG